MSNIKLSNFSHCPNCGKIVEIAVRPNELCTECFIEDCKNYKHGYRREWYKAKWSDYIEEDLIEKYVVGDLDDADMAGDIITKMLGM